MRIYILSHSQKNIRVFSNGHLVSRSSDYIMYSVEAENVDSVVGQYGPCVCYQSLCSLSLLIFMLVATKLGAIVGGQTSCKAPEIAAFEKHLPSDVEIVSCHSLHGPGVNPKGQPLVLIKHRASQESFEKVEYILSCLESKHVYLTWQQHDRITADTQAVTHAAFLRYLQLYLLVESNGDAESSNLCPRLSLSYLWHTAYECHQS